ncbi:hypothetical protein CVT24_013336 [Panaeolus cyanescens]|uniref:Uncharacterized protein n=1 Tax=Panaeolus cyanescens TaxID=181874 RepID=A0A409X270_9AGAR|nr:hypothetical protein CVT24_013336 [Panaeolus cyanescens]
MPSNSKTSSSRRIITSDAENNIKRETLTPDINYEMEVDGTPENKGSRTITGKKSKRTTENIPRTNARGDMKTGTVAHQRTKAASPISIDDSSGDDEGANPILPHDDSPYIDSKAIPATIRAKRALAPSEPALMTRNAAKASKPSSGAPAVGASHVDNYVPDPSESHRIVKKKRISSDEYLTDREESVEVNVPKTPTPSRKGKETLNVGFLTEHQTKVRKDTAASRDGKDGDSKGPTSNTTVDNDEEETFASSAWFGNKKLQSNASGTQDGSGGAGGAEVYLEDLHLRRVLSLPEVCEVHDATAEDSYLASINAYADLFPLKLTTCYPHKIYANSAPMEDMGLLIFSNWSEYCPKLRIRVATSVITFKKEEHFVNLSRMDPRDLVARPINVNNTAFELAVWKDKRLVTATCLSPIAVRESCTQEKHNLLKTYMISGRFHTVEFDRYVSLMGMVMGVEEIGIRLYGDIVTFSVYSPSGVSSKVAHHNNADDSKFLSTMVDTTLSPSRGSRTRGGVNSSRVAVDKSTNF